jgi:iron complex transport system ATP-binding protein
MTVLRCEELSYRLGRRVILQDISLTLNPGDNIALLGANGAGKSTLLRLLLGLIRPASGQVYLGSQRLSALSRRAIAQQMAYVPQSHVPSFPYTVEHIIAQGRLPVTGLGHAPASADLQAVSHALAQLGIEALRTRCTPSCPAASGNWC